MSFTSLKVSPSKVKGLHTRNNRKDQNVTKRMKTVEVTGEKEKTYEKEEQKKKMTRTQK